MRTKTQNLSITLVLGCAAFSIGSTMAVMSAAEAQRPAAPQHRKATRTPPPSHTPVATVTPAPTPPPAPSCWAVVPIPPVPGFAAELSSVSGSGPNDVWAVGYFDALDAGGNSGSSHTLTLHWNGSSWSVIPSPDANTAGTGVINRLHGVAVIAPNDAWAVGYSTGGSQGYRTLTMHWDGASWQIVPSPNLPLPNLYNALNSVSAISPNEVWAVGGVPKELGNGVSSRATLMRWDGTAWTLTPEPAEAVLWNSSSLNAVTAVASNEVWAVGDLGRPFRWNGSAWTLSGPAFPSQFTKALDHTAASNIWAVGAAPPVAGSEGSSFPASATSARFDGAAWTFSQPALAGTNNTTAFRGVTAVSPSNAWAVGFVNQSTLVQRWNGTAWTVVGSANGNPILNANRLVNNMLNSVHANSATDIWAVGTFIDSSDQQRILIERYTCQ